jgi:hypothetical protein
MYDHSLFLRTVSEVSGRLLTPSDVDVVLRDTLARLVEVFGLAGAGVALAEEGKVRSTVGFPAAVDALEQVQHEQQAGPAAEAFGTGEVVAVPDLAAYADRWPAYCDWAAKRSGRWTCTPPGAAPGRRRTWRRRSCWPTWSPPTW